MYVAAGSITQSGRLQVGDPCSKLNQSVDYDVESISLFSLLFQLIDRNIGNSRDTSFEQLIMLETNGRGVDLVLNSLSEEKLQASVRCLAIGGRFLEIGKFDLSNNRHLGRSYFVNLLFLVLLVHLLICSS